MVQVSYLIFKPWTVASASTSLLIFPWLVPLFQECYSVKSSAVELCWLVLNPCRLPVRGFGV